MLISYFFFQFQANAHTQKKNNNTKVNRQVNTTDSFHKILYYTSKT